MAQAQFLLWCVLLVLSVIGQVRAFGATGYGSVVSRRSPSTSLNMKLFDWKKRGQFVHIKMPEDFKLGTNTIFPVPGSRQKFHRIGRGHAAGQGGSCGKGMRGQNSRKGGGTRPGFEGGQTPLYRRIPKIYRPQKGHTKTIYEIIKLNLLNLVEPGSEVDATRLMSEGLLTKPNKGRKIYKVLGEGELKVENLTVRAQAFTASARAAIEAKGGTCILMSPTRLNVPLAQAEAEKAVIKAANLVKLKALRALKRKTKEAKEMEDFERMNAQAHKRR